ncbi:hypothetical protein COCON_G00236250, partial [Conger conger]
WNLNGAHISKQRKYDLYLEPELKNAGVFTFIQTKPEKVHLAQIEVFAIEVKPSHWHTEREGSDVTMSCEVSHLPDSATLAWERDREPTANTTLIYNNTAHIIIHSVDQHSEGTYNCTLRRNGALIFSVPKLELKVTKGTFETRHTLYRGSMNSSEVALICHSLSSYTKASWSWVPVSERQAILVASAGKCKNAAISMEMDKERVSSDVYDGSKFPLKISPVKFGDSGRYTCIYERNRMAEKIWYLFRENRKQQKCLSKASLSRAPWWSVQESASCAELEQVPLHLTLPIKQGWSTETVVRVVIVALATLGMLLVLRWYWSWTRRQANICFRGVHLPLCGKYADNNIKILHLLTK